MEELQCVICGSNNPKLITSSRVTSFCKASHQRGDGKADNVGSDVTAITCHINCISTYCSSDHIKRHLKKKEGKDNHLK